MGWSMGRKEGEIELAADGVNMGLNPTSAGCGV